MSWLRRLLGINHVDTLPPEGRGAEVVEFLRASPIVCSWSRMVYGNLEEVWQTCPRVDWLADIAIRAGVPRDRVAEALDRIVDKFESPAEGELIATLSAFLDQHIDNDPEVQYMRDLEAYNVQANRSVNRLWDEAPDAKGMVDDLEHGFHRRLADRFRDDVPYSLLRERLYPNAGAGPYR